MGGFAGGFADWGPDPERGGVRGLGPRSRTGVRGTGWAGQGCYWPTLHPLALPLRMADGAAAGADGGMAE